MNQPVVSVITPIRAVHEESVGWLREAIESVQAQTFKEWEMIIVSDRSRVSLKPVAELIRGDDRIVAAKGKGKGVSDARNQAAEMATGQFLLPLDHDDILPPTAMATMLEAWRGGGKDFGVVYGDVVSFGVNFQKNMQMPRFGFPTLLRTLIMPIGSLHEKSAWEAIGGWDPKFQSGLEDWEYWIRMTVNGFHGFHVDAVTYHYRRHALGRLAALRKDDKLFAAARQAVREKHIDYYNGKEPKMCRGCGKVRPASFRAAGAPARTVPMSIAAKAGDLVLVNYIGARGGSFHVTGRASGNRYEVQGGKGSLVLGPNGKPGVHPADAQYFRSYDGGRAFKIEPSPPPPPQPRPVPTPAQLGGDEEPLRDA